MRYRALTSSGDYSFGHGQANMLINSPEAVAQAVMTRLKLFTGEYFVDLLEGTPYVPGVLGRHTAETYDAVFRERILATEGVTELVSYESELDRDTRRLGVYAEINTVYGRAAVQGVL